MLITPEMVRAARTQLVREVPVVLIEDDDDDPTTVVIDYTVAQLRRVLAELDAMAPLPRGGSAEAVAIHDTWMQQSKAMSRLVRDAECLALAVVPDEVNDMLHIIRTRELVLMGLMRDPDESSEDRLERQAQAHLESAALHRDDPMF